MPPVPKFEGPLSVNNKFDKVEFLLKGQIQGPESLLIEGDTIYAGTDDGTMVKIVNGKIVKTVVLSSDENCRTKKDRLKNHDICGRPLGLRRLNKDELVSTDLYRGIITINFEKGAYKIVFPNAKKVDGLPMNFPNDLEVIDENTVIFSESTSKWTNVEFLYDFLENGPNGRIIQLNIKTGEAKVLLDKLFYANGVQLFPDKKSILISECSMARITRYYIDGPKKGQREIFIENLPGIPDNIRLNSKGNFYIPFPTARIPDTFDLRDFLGPYPWVRTLMYQLIPMWVMQNAAISKYGLFIEVDPNGKILQSWHETNGILPLITQASDDEKFIYLGGLLADYIARIPK